MAGMERIRVIPRSVAPRTRQRGYPAPTRAFDLTALALATWVLLGAYVDGIAHVHGAADETFFTPWHLLLYTGLLAKGLFLTLAQLRNVSRGHHWLEALPRGYLLSLVGVLLMGLGGFLDFLWHTAFGIEADIEASLSPPHLLLASGALLFMSGPLRALWGRPQAQRGWSQLFPAIASALLVWSIFSVFTQFVHAISWVEHYTLPQAPGPVIYDHVLTARVLLPTILLSTTLLLLLRRWPLPAGAVTFLLLANSTLMYLLRSAEFGGARAQVLLAALLAGLAGDLLLRRLQRPRVSAGGLRLFAFALPFVYHLAFFVILQLGGGIWWSIHMWLGVSVLAGMFSLGLSFLAVPPPLPVEAPPAAGRGA